MEKFKAAIKDCEICADHLPLGANPVFQFGEGARVVIIGQAPGRKVHQSGIPWDDASGNRLREWLDISTSTFYDPDKLALVPMGFCYPGKGKSGDLPPRPECAPKWHDRILARLENVGLRILIGQYAQQYYLHGRVKRTLTETVKAYGEYLPSEIPLPHPSPRNNIWLRKNPWFEKELLPVLQGRIALLMAGI
ncbi:MAG: uracil-DNA glycosylase family protein [Cytophagales bacterium]|nr:uracil-DNA glycosylase family protein [Cytophagales bacterium]